MQSSIRVVVSLALLASALASFDSGTKLRRDGGYSHKLRRDGVLNLYPFPRVGRAHNTWQSPLHHLFMDRAIDYEPIGKRQLYAFPRVGRGDPSLRDQELTEQHRDFQAVPARRNSGGDNPGMWFGPRLGRSFKSDDDDISIESDTYHSEPEQLETDSIHEDREQRDAKLL